MAKGTFSEQTIQFISEKCLVEKYCIEVNYKMHLGTTPAREYFGTWDTKAEAEEAKKDVLVKEKNMLLAKDLDVWYCEVRPVFVLPSSLGQRLGGRKVMVVDLKGPYMGIF